MQDELMQRLHGCNRVVTTKFAAHSGVGPLYFRYRKVIQIAYQWSFSVSDSDKDFSLFDRIFYAVCFLILGAVMGSLIGFFGGLFTTERSFSDIMYPWAYILGGAFGVIGYIFPRLASVTFLFLGGCQFMP